MMSCGTFLLKYLLFAFNFVFWISGLGLVIAGAVMHVKYQAFAAFLGGEGGVLSVPILLIIVGCAINVIGFFGCFGALKESSFLISIYGLLVFLVFIAEVGAGVAAYMYKDMVVDEIRGTLKKGMKHYGAQGSDAVTKGWDAVNQQFQCCGVGDYKSWAESGSELLTADKSVPDSCCVTITDGCGKGMAGKDAVEIAGKIHNRGCLTGFAEFMQSNIAIVGGVSAGVALIEIMGVILSCCYCKGLRKKEKGSIE